MLREAVALGGFLERVPLLMRRTGADEIDTPREFVSESKYRSTEVPKCRSTGDLSADVSWSAGVSPSHRRATFAPRVTANSNAIAEELPAQCAA